MLSAVAFGATFSGWALLSGQDQSPVEIAGAVRSDIRSVTAPLAFRTVPSSGPGPAQAAPAPVVGAVAPAPARPLPNSRAVPPRPRTRSS